MNYKWILDVSTGSISCLAWVKRPLSLLARFFPSLRGRRRKGREGSSASARNRRVKRDPPADSADRASRSFLALRARTPLLPPLYTPATQTNSLPTREISEIYFIDPKFPIELTIGLVSVWVPNESLDNHLYPGLNNRWKSIIGNPDRSIDNN